LDITVETTVSPGRCPAAFQRAPTHQQDAVSIYDLAACRYENGAIRVAIERRPEVRSRAQPAREPFQMQRAAIQIDVRPFGSVQMVVTSAPARRNNSGASR